MDLVFMSRRQLPQDRMEGSAGRSQSRTGGRRLQLKRRESARGMEEGWMAKMARPPRLERGTLCLEGRCSIRLSYGRCSGWVTINARNAAPGKLIVPRFDSWRVWTDIPGGYLHCRNAKGPRGETDTGSKLESPCTSYSATATMEGL